MPPYINESFTTCEHEELTLQLLPLNDKCNATHQAKSILATSIDFASQADIDADCIRQTPADGKVPQHHLCSSDIHSIEDDLNAKTNKLDNVETRIRTLKWQLKGATDKVNGLSEECRNIKHISNMLKEERGVLLDERDQLWRIVNEGEVDTRIKMLIKEQSNMNAEKVILRREETNRALSCGMKALKLMIFSAGVMYLI